MTESSSSSPRVVSAGSARFAAKLFNYGNIVAMLVPLPLGILWMGASIMVYAMNRHHPNPKVGHYTQHAAMRLYALVGFVVVLATFFGTDPTAWLFTWAIAAAILIPWSIVDLVRISRDDWRDVELTGEHQ